MEKIRMNLFAKYAMVLGLNLIAMAPTHASVTKVGNGDDGADLETLTQITSGPILAARQRAIETVKQLNVTGIPGMGLLIPELEHSNLFMATKDVHPTGEQQGSLEIAADKGFVYARTFAEPYAPTRFFPAAETLTSEQLVALHIHEALHRALPADIRTDENKVMHLTMAMTSPGASYDRVHQVAGLYINAETANTAQRATPQLNSTVSVAPIVLPEKSRTEFKLGTDMYNTMNLSWNSNVLHKLDIKTSLGGYKQLGSLAIESAFRFRATTYQKFEGGAGIGPTSYDLEGRIKADEQTVVGPLLRFTAKSFDEHAYTMNERDIVTIGAFYRNSGDISYFESNLLYSFGSTAGTGDMLSAQYKPILSLMTRTGVKWKNIALGFLFDVHASEGREISVNEQLQNQVGYWQQPTQGMTRSGFRILAVGPEFGFEGKTLQFKFYGKRIINQPAASFDDLGDVMDRGAGEEINGMYISAAF